jgi:hypothetical protein
MSAPSSRWSRAAPTGERSREASPGAARGGVTALGRGGVLVRLLAPSAPALTQAAEVLWAETRRLLFGVPPLGLRKL